MGNPAVTGARATPPALHERAADELRFIRATMERAAAFTAVPGWGGVIVGFTALGAAWASGGDIRDPRWLRVWLGEGMLAATIGFSAMARKANAAGTSLIAAPARRFALAYLPAMTAGAVLTAVLARNGLVEQLPGCWLLLYGVSLTAGGAFSVRVVPIMGLTFMLIGTTACFAPTGWSNGFMAAGFGAAHIAFGFIIARRYGG